MTDKDLKQHVQNALEWEPSIDQSDIGVSADEGVVTLRGNVRSFSEKWLAEQVALRVYGVKGIANDLEVRIGRSAERTDTELAQAAVNALGWNTLVPAGKVTVSVTHGFIALKGAVDWQYEKDAAARAVRDLTSLKGVINQITVKPRVSAPDLRDKIEAAFTRSAEIDARRINVTATDGKVILSGNVKSWAERREAERAAWAAPGVTQVDDRLFVTP
jgi:osmotically-inducible protein OsmY